MGSHPSSPVKVTDLLINMVGKAANQDQEFLLDLTALQARQEGWGWGVEVGLGRGAARRWYVHSFLRR